MISKVFRILGILVSKTYKYRDDHFSYDAYIKFFIWQKILGINKKIPWPVHFTSYVTGAKNITFGKRCSPGSNIGQYIQANSKVIMGDNVLMGPGSKIISANHDFSDFSKHIESEAVRIGSNVWIGADAIILPRVTVGNNVVIGAGSIVTKDIPSNVIAAGNPCKVLKVKGPYKD